jgi:hypothetical protein
MMIVRLRVVARLGRQISLAAAVLGLLSLAACDGGDGVKVSVLRGNVRTVNETHGAIDFVGKRVAGPRLHHIDVDGGWIVAGGRWFDGRSWHDNGTAVCLERPLPQPIELGVVEAAEGHDAPGGGVVVWLKCLTRS